MILEHQVRNRKVKPLKGVFIVVAVMVLIYILAILTSLLAQWITSTGATILLWALGAGIALWTMRRYIMYYNYELTGALLHITYRYGRHERLYTDIYMNALLDAGEPEKIRSKYPNAKVARATRVECADAPLMLAYKADKTVRLMIIQPSPAMRDAITERVPKKK